MSAKSIAENWFKAFNDHNLEKLLELYHDNAQHYSPKLKLKHPDSNGLIKGKEALRTWWKEAFQHIPTLSYHPNFILCEGDKVFMEYVRKADGDADLVVGELLVIENGLIVASKVYHS
ncbi:MAG TPA: nuclear transport factor 2 family protein [Flavobacteriales bacterium]|nr:nuclear transport factor 2 family protein [Flavobacteriales bacterium]